MIKLRFVHRDRVLAVLLAASVSACTTLNIPLLSRTGLPEQSAGDPARLEKSGKWRTASGAGGTAGAPAQAEPAPAPATNGPRPTEFPIVDDRLAGELRFQSGDAVKVLVWGYPELDHTATIQPNGKITLPLSGEIDAAGSSAAELRQRIVDGLEQYTHTASSELRAGDSLSIEVWQHNELRHTAVIDPAGFVTFPLAGRMQASDRSVEDVRKEAERRLTKHLRDARVTILPIYNNRRVLYDRHVSVLAQSLQPRRVALIGEVGVPGLVEIRGSLRIVEALALAQMRDKSAELNSIVVIRNYDGQSPQYRMIRLADYFAGIAPDQNIFLQNNDIVVVPKTAIAKAGEFVENFFTRTAPVFSWWSALFQASVARESADTTRLINESLQRSINAISVNPSR